jgi:tRNA (cytidine56-2'-O)-methyltransferase
MYGLNLDEDMDEIRKTTGDILLVVGAKKVPSELYEESDFNIAVGNQPHSEVAALAVFLDRLFKGEEFKREFNHGKYRIVSSRKRKHLEKIR